MSVALKHRGPDDDGAVDLLDATGEAVGVLAHRRLAVLDLSPGGHQPMSWEPRGLTIGYNGEIYNFRDLRRDLAARGFEFRTDSDTEVLLAGWACDGPAFLPRLRGMFAFIIWERGTSTAYLVRDRFGIKPLYVAQRPGVVAVASEVRALVMSGVAPNRLTASGLATYLATGSTGEPETIIDGVRSVPAGCWVRVRMTQSGPVIQAPTQYATVPVREQSTRSESSPAGAARLFVMPFEMLSPPIW